MNYQKLYDTIMANAKRKNREKGQGTYYESHHIIPECAPFYGRSTKKNLVLLTAREHFLAHRLLAKLYPSNKGLRYAEHRMVHHKAYRITSRVYEQVRKNYADYLRNDKERSAEISKRLKGKKKTKEHAANWKKSRENGAGWFCSEERKAILSETMKGENNPNYGRPHSEEAVRKIQEANRQKIECPHCNKIGGIAIMKRWHFDNCKLSPSFIGRKKYPTSQCPHCGFVGGGARMISNHFENCKQSPR